MRIVKKCLALVLCLAIMVPVFSVPASAARNILSYQFSLTSSNRNDQNGVFDEYNGYQSKKYSYKPAAIRVDSNSGRYSVKLTLNYNNPNRATEFVLLDEGERGTPEYINGYGSAWQTFKLWCRQNAGETRSSTKVDGTWSPDDQDY